VEIIFEAMIFGVAEEKASVEVFNARASVL